MFSIGQVIVLSILCLLIFSDFNKIIKNFKLLVKNQSFIKLKRKKNRKKGT